MKSRVRSTLSALPWVLALAHPAWAAPVTKHSAGTDLTGVGAWGTGTGPAPGSSDVATWSAGSLGGALTIGSSIGWQGIDVQTATAAITTSGAGTLTLGSSGINIAASGVNLTLGNHVTLGANQNWTVGSGRTLTFSNTTAPTLTFNADVTLDGAGSVIFGGGNIALAGAGALIVNSGTVTNNMQAGSSSTRTGTTTLGGGSIIISSSQNLFGSGAIHLNGGALGSGTVTGRSYANTVNIGGNVRIGGTGFGSGTMTFSGPIGLGGATRQIDSGITGGQGVILSGAISNGGLTLNSTGGTGILTLSNDSNAYTGATTVSSGYLAISNNAISNSSSISFAANTRLFVGVNGTTNINNLSGASTASIRTDFTITGTSAARTLKVNQSADGTFAGSFTEGGSRPISLVKSGTAKLTLSGAGGYSGGTTISQGTLVAANSSALGASGTVTINDASTGTNNTTLQIDATGAAVTIARPITVANQGSGTVTLGSATTGGSNAAIFSGAITLAKDVTLNGGSAGDRFSTTGGISGTGSLTIAGTNRVLFVGATNTYNGSTSINAGSTLQLSDGTVTATSFIPDASAVTVGSGGFLKLAKGGNSETIGALAGTGTVEAISGNDTLVVGSGDASSSFDGSLKNNGGTLALTKTGTGTLALTGTGSNYTGATSVSGGTLVVNGNISTSTLTTVQSGATIGGSGTVGALSVLGGGTLAPGTSPGTLSTGTLTLANTSISAFELNPSDETVGLGINDLVTVTGNLTLDGILNVIATSGDFLSVIEGTSWRLFNYSGSLTDNTLTLGTMPALGAGLDWSVDTTTTGEVNLVVIPEPGAALLGGLGLICLLRRRR